MLTRLNHWTIRHMRRARGYTQAGLADTLGLDRSTVSLWEQGRRNPTAPNAKRLADTLGVDVDDLARPLNVRMLRADYGGNR